ncbi:urease accessory protein UreE [Methylobacterium sp. E-016]|jgi:urease accessory protein|uniref:urease accessory protein UreE n=1 Tax=unclassified Methylobacterium TaxID=2615210 RepID=UPI0011CB5082|nr:MULTISPECIES: urease accessory protein UreE [unclassified Methylobacterium]MCJ2006710.1 urease accessory protein UreE [Methylobacterium sp. J-092]MCJ2079366.1 urease accessory protein UreE [Methylobacterium sp. E-016]TXM90456.1 urease accessory protein UreE [Methylobacterium sp. WL116]
MPRATTIVRKAAVRPDAVVDTISLDHAGRQAQHGHLHSAGGLHIDLALTKAAGLEDGDALRLDDGRLVAVKAAPEALLEIRAENPARLIRLAWQLGGNHVPAEIGAEVLHVPASPATAELVRGQGCTASPVDRAFRPERMAHDHSTCGHDHSHDHHDHAAHADRDHGHDHTHADDRGHDHHAHDPAPHDHAPHVHGPGCSHDH